jgi:hypothetical protein
LQLTAERTAGIAVLHDCPEAATGQQRGQSGGQ